MKGIYQYEINSVKPKAYQVNTSKEFSFNTSEQSGPSRTVNP